MAQWVKICVVKPDYLSLIPGARAVEEINQP